MEDGIIISITTYPKRIEYFKKAFNNILELNGMKRIWKIIVAIDDNLTDVEYSEYDRLLGKLDTRIEIIRCDSRWRSANKLIPAYNLYGQDHAIITFDDDKDYPKNCLEQLLDSYSVNNGVIVAQEINPLIVKNSSIGYLEDLDVKLGQLEWGKYLSNACMFPPKCFGDGKLLNDYDKFCYVTNCIHDELWFWIVSTVCGVRSIGLSNTMAYGLDDGVCYPDDATALRNTNSQIHIINEYNSRVTEMFGTAMLSSILEKHVEFKVCKENYLGTVYGMNYINSLYDGQPIDFVVDKSMPRSFMVILSNAIRRCKWHSNVNMRIS